MAVLEECGDDRSHLNASLLPVTLLRLKSGSEGLHVGSLSNEHAADYHRCSSGTTSDLRAQIIGEEDDYRVDLWLPPEIRDTDS